MTPSVKAIGVEPIQIISTPDPGVFIMASRLSPDLKAAVLDALRAAFTEERTDDLIRRATSKLPLWLRWLPIGAALDRMLPDIILNFVEENL